MFKTWKTSQGSLLWVAGPCKTHSTCATDLSGYWENILGVLPYFLKTDVSSTVIEHISDYCSENPLSSVAYFYCNGNVPEKQDVRFILGSILRQLLPKWVKVDGSTESSRIYSLYKKHRTLKSTYSLVRDLEDMVKSAANVFSTVYLLIDGLDEMTEREEIVSVALRLSSSRIFNVLFVSRPVQDLEKRFSNALKLRIGSGQVSGDIKTYVKWRLKTDPKLCSIEPLLKGEIENKLMKQSDGMFVLCPLTIS